VPPGGQAIAITLDDGRRAVGRAVVDDEVAHVARLVREHAFDGLAKEGLAVENGRDDG
jgi:hypothetical protein